MKRRTPLEERGARGEWSEFESELFNLVGVEISRIRPALFREMVFHERLQATQVMLDAFDKFIEETTP